MLLEEIFKLTRADYSDAFNLRIQRGISWLKKAYDLQEDFDLHFISLWISFNAIFAQDESAARDAFNLFLTSLCAKDHEGKIERILWKKYRQPVQVLMQQKMLYPSYWDYQNQKISLEQCQICLAQEQQKQEQAVQQRDTLCLLSLLFQRLQTLHKQALQGGMVYGSAMQRKYLQGSCQVLGALLPVFILLLIENAQAMDLGKPYYPAAQAC